MWLEGHAKTFVATYAAETFRDIAIIFWGVDSGVKILRPTRLHFRNIPKTFGMFRKFAEASVAGKEI